MIHFADGKLWQQVGLDRVINIDKRTRWSNKVDSDKNSELMIGVSTKNIVTCKNSYSGQFMYGWTFCNTGVMYHFGRYQRTVL